MENDAFFKSELMEHGQQSREGDKGQRECHIIMYYDKQIGVIKISEALKGAFEKMKNENSFITAQRQPLIHFGFVLTTWIMTYYNRSLQKEVNRE